MDVVLQKTRAKDQQGAMDALGRLVVAAAAGVPWVGPLAVEGMRMAVARSAYQRMDAAIDLLEAEEDDDARARKTARYTVALLSAALLGLAEELRDNSASRAQMPGVEESIESMRRDIRSKVVSNVRVLHGGATGAEIPASKPLAHDVEQNIDEATGKGTTVLKFT